MGGITVIASCFDGSIATKTVRVTNAGQWVIYDSCDSELFIHSYWCCLHEITEIINGEQWTEKAAIVYSPYDCLTHCYSESSSCGGLFPVSHFGCFVERRKCYVGSWKKKRWQCLPCTNGQTISCYSGASETKGVGVCKAGTQTCVNGQWGACQGEILPTPEICDGLDNDCNGIMDDIPALCYTGPIGTQGIGICKTGTQACENGTLSACVGDVSPQEEICDGLDNNCDGEVDEGCIKCALQPLTPLTDLLAIYLENGGAPLYAYLIGEMQSAVDCLDDDIFNIGGIFRLTSAYRPPQYQQHLREIWDKYMYLNSNRNMGPECNELRAQVDAEFLRHGLQESQQPSVKSNHSKGIAIDANVILPAGYNTDGLANGCGLFRPIPKKDPVHFELKK